MATAATGRAGQLLTDAVEMAWRSLSLVTEYPRGIEAGSSCASTSRRRAAAGTAQSRRVRSALHRRDHRLRGLGDQRVVVVVVLAVAAGHDGEHDRRAAGRPQDRDVVAG